MRSGVTLRMNKEDRGARLFLMILVCKDYKMNNKDALLFMRLREKEVLE